MTYCLCERCLTAGAGIDVKIKGSVDASVPPIMSGVIYMEVAAGIH